MTPTTTISPATTRRSPVFRTSRASAAPIADASVVDRWKERAAKIDKLITQRTLPFWCDDAFAGSANGYRLGYNATRGRFVEDGRLIVSQARLVWAFSRAHRMGYSDANRDYLAAARHGYEHLQRSFLDPIHGGYYWRVRDSDVPGMPADDMKVLYGNSFVLYALVECARAANDAKVLDNALSLFKVLADHQPVPLCVSESAQGNFDPRFDPGDKLTGVAVPGYHCANTSLHWMEALTELHRDLPDDPAVGRALVDALELNRTQFYARDLDSGYDYVPSGKDVAPWPKPKVVSYGHNIEFAWLMIDAQNVLGETPDWNRAEAILKHTLESGFDHDRGGIYNVGTPHGKATDLTKPWWPQAEMIATLSYLIASGHASRSYDAELTAMLDWYEGPQMHPATESPYDCVSADGKKIVDATISGQWQAAYHDLRARWIFIESLGGGR